MQTVMVVEDEKLIRQGIATMIKRTGVPVCEIIECANGLQAMEVLREKKVDVVFTDIRMPNMDGLTMLAALGSEFPRMQKAVLTAYRDFEYARQAIVGPIRIGAQWCNLTGFSASMSVGFDF